MNDVKKVENYGIKWGPFTLKIPFIHIKFLTAEFLQGMVISGATAFAGAPVVMALGLSFEEADRKSTRLNSSHSQQSRMPSSA